jgi:hypothetical protein
MYLGTLEEPSPQAKYEIINHPALVYLSKGGKSERERKRKRKKNY